GHRDLRPPLVLRPVCHGHEAASPAGRFPFAAAAFDDRSMPPNRNPLNRNPLQLNTLTLLQPLARLPDHATSEGEGVRVDHLTRPHGDHPHLGAAVVLPRHPSGLFHPAAWA